MTTAFLADDDNPTGYTQRLESHVSGSSGLATTYLLGDRVLGQQDGNGTAFLLADGHGSTQALAIATGGIAESYRYDAFGTAVNFDADTAGTVVLFGGDATYDPSTGLYDHGDGVRQRDGFRFIQRDSLDGINQRPITFGKYLYAGANSVQYADFDGHDFSLPSLGVAVGIGAALGGLSGGLYSYQNGGSAAQIAAGMAEGIAVGALSGLASGLFAYAMAGALTSAGLSEGMAIAATGGFFGGAGIAMSSAGLYQAYQNDDPAGMIMAGTGLLLSVGILGYTTRGFVLDLSSAPEAEVGNSIKIGVDVQQTVTGPRISVDYGGKNIVVYADSASVQGDTLVLSNTDIGADSTNQIGAGGLKSIARALAEKYGVGKIRGRESLMTKRRLRRPGR